MEKNKYWETYISAYEKVVLITKLINDFISPGEYQYNMINSSMSLKDKIEHVCNDMESQEFANLIHYDFIDNLEYYFPSSFHEPEEMEQAYNDLNKIFIPMLDCTYDKLKNDVFPFLYTMNVNIYKTKNTKQTTGLTNKQIWDKFIKEPENAAYIDNVIENLIKAMVIYYSAYDLLKDQPNPIDEILKECYQLTDIEYARQINKKQCSIIATASKDKESNIDCNFAAFEKYFEDMFGQGRAIDEIQKVLKRTILFHNAEDINGESDKKGPLATFMFYGPTGTGKTQAAKNIADFVFNDNKKLLILDMNSYKDGKIGASAIKGHPEGYANSESGTDFTRFLKKHNQGVIVLDEFEKADPSVREIFMTMLDEGEFKDALGNNYDLSSYIFIATTNANPKVNNQKNIIGFTSDSQEKITLRNEKNLKDGLREIFTSPIINRFNNVIHFKKIEYQDALDICSNVINHLKSNFESKRFYGEVPTITIDNIEDISKIILDRCDYQKDGVRSVKNVINDTIGSEIIEQILAKNYKIHINVKNGQINVGLDKKNRTR